MPFTFYTCKHRAERSVTGNFLKIFLFIALTLRVFPTSKLSQNHNALRFFKKKIQSLNMHKTIPLMWN